ncbi:MAG TPA: TIR domain-containing protein [Actinophytocola sp.]|jgi:hypothetical protein|nr:TIR domain-containing protein [Actinophytocola sp.]
MSFAGNGHDHECSNDLAGSSDVDPVRGGLCRVFVSYSHVDEAERVRLDVHLAPLAREGLIDLWCNRVIAPASDWKRDIESVLVNADIVILLVTADFVASVYCFETELAEALRRHHEEGVRILPVLVKPVDFAHMPFGRFQALPRDLRPISTWDNSDAAWLEVALGVRELVEDVYRSRTEVPAQRNGSDLESDKTLLGRQLNDYYGVSSCVVDGPVADDQAVEWIPLDEDSSAMRFDNLVPISTRHRDRTLRYATGTLKNVTFRFGIDLIAENVFHSARRHFHAGAPALAFGCSRLGDALAVHYPYFFETHEGDDWAFLAQSLFYLPYRMHPVLLEATLRRVRFRLETADCPHGACAALLVAIANLYQDCGEWAKADELYDAVLAAAPSPALRAVAIRRRAVGGLFGRETHETMDRMFRSIVGYTTNADLAVALAIARGWWHLSRGRPEQCLQVVAPFDFDEQAPIPAPMYSPHHVIEFKLTQAAALDALGLSCGSQLRFVRQYGQARLRPVFTDFVAPRVFGPAFGSVVQQFRGEVSFAPAVLDSTAAALLRTKGTAVPGRPIWVD